MSRVKVACRVRPTIDENGNVTDDEQPFYLESEQNQNGNNNNNVIRFLDGGPSFTVDSVYVNM